MRNRLIGLLDLGLDSRFDASMSFEQSTLQAINAGWEEPVLDIDFIRSRDTATVITALTAPYHVLHVMAHGDSEDPAFLGEDGSEVSLAELGTAAAEQGRGLQSGVVLADACRTGTGTWQKAFRDCLQGDITYIGTSGNIGWHESTVFCSAFYGALSRNRGKGLSPAEQGEDAARRAVEAYETLTDREVSLQGHDADAESSGLEEPPPLVPNSKSALPAHLVSN